MIDRSVALALDVEESVLPLPAETLQAHIEKVLERVDFPGSLSLAVVDDERMRELNRDFHATDAPTDVLAFPLDEPDLPPEAGIEAGIEPGIQTGFAAEVVVSVTTALREAEARGVDPAAELVLYAVHGILHLVGEDDHEPEAARRMHVRTLGILRELGLDNDIEMPADSGPDNPGDSAVR